jgi:hypothetical protein
VRGIIGALDGGEPELWYYIPYKQNSAQGKRRGQYLVPVNGKPGIYVPEVSVVSIGGTDEVVIKQFPFTESYKVNKKGKQSKSSSVIEMQRPFTPAEIAPGIAALEKERAQNK